MKRLVLRLVPAIILTIILQPIMTSFAQEGPLTMENTSWNVFVFSFDQNGQFTKFTFDQFYFKGGRFKAKNCLTPCPYPAPYSESYSVVPPSDFYTIWECTVPWGFVGELETMGIRSTKKPDLIIGKQQFSLSAGYSIFLGTKKLISPTP